jgi:hypothetical protein
LHLDLYEICRTNPQAREAWLCFMYQTVKTFVLSRVTAKSFRALPGLDPALCVVDSNATASNVFSTPENILLKWLQVRRENEMSVWDECVG